MIAGGTAVRRVVRGLTYRPAQLTSRVLWLSVDQLCWPLGTSGLWRRRYSGDAAVGMMQAAQYRYGGDPTTWRGVGRHCLWRYREPLRDPLVRALPIEVGHVGA